MLSDEGGISLSHKPESLLFMATSNGVKGKTVFLGTRQEVNFGKEELSHADISKPTT